MTTPAEICIFDTIGGDGVTAANIIAQLNALDGQPATVRINSDGGSVTEGVAIFNALRRYKGGVTVVIDYAASIASYIALAGSRVTMAGNAYLMIHDPACTVRNGSSAELRQTADLVDKMREMITAAYVFKSGKSPEDIAAAMNAETWLTASEALAWGFVDEITEPLAIAAKFDPSKFKNPPRVDTSRANNMKTVKNEDAPAETPETDAPDTGGTEHADPVALDPCPFCGNSELDDSGEQVKCSNCQAVGPVAGSGMDARGAWNSRASDAEPTMDDVPAPDADPMATAAKFKNVADARKAFTAAAAAHFKAHAAAVKFAKQAEELNSVRVIAAEVVAAKVEAEKSAKALADYKAGEPARINSTAQRMLAASGHPAVSGSTTSSPGNPAGNGATMKRSDFDALPSAKRSAFTRGGGRVTE